MDSGLQRFQPGETITIREVLNGKVWTVRPVIVAQDTTDQLVSYLAPGTLIDYPVGVEHGEKCFAMWLSGDWELCKKTLLPPGMLRIAPHGKPFEVFARLGKKAVCCLGTLTSSGHFGELLRASTQWTRPSTS